MSPTTIPGKLIMAKDYINAGLLNEVGNAAAGFSLRYLSREYQGPVVRVRRSSDNTEQDFTAAEVTDGTLTTFCGAGDGFVRTWYDQSGNNYNAIQSNATLQPRIVNSGALETVNNEPAIYTNLNSTDAAFGLSADINGFQTLSNLSVFAQITPVNPTAADQFDNLGIFNFGDPNVNGLAVADATSLLSNETLAIAFADGTARRLGSSIYSRSANTQSLFSSFHLSTGTSIYANGNQINLNLTNGMTTTTAAAPVNTGYTSDNLVKLGPNSLDSRPVLMQEYIFYPSDQTANRTIIELNINAYYDIF